MELTQQLPEQQEWQDLIKHQRSISNLRLRDIFAEDPERFTNFSLEVGGLFLDYSRNLVTSDTISMLMQLAEASKLRARTKALFDGETINTTERRAVLHSALRNFGSKEIKVRGKNIVPEIKALRSRLQQLVEDVLSGQFLSATGKPIQTIVNIGIGGSHLGPMMTTYALKDHHKTALKFYFISSVDKDGVDDVLQVINPEHTLFIISSKTFSTIETLTNARTIASWMKTNYGASALHKQFIAVTSAHDKAVNFGIDPDRIFPLWDWVGGRYSIWSAIGLPLMFALGNEAFDDFLQGAYEVDQHFINAPFSQNMPVIMALLGIWYNNFLGCQAQAIIPYAHRLRYLIAYLQQAEMESNGKSTDLHGQKIGYTTGPVIFGEEGCNGQHAYHQLLLQGNHVIPVDFILVGRGEHYTDDKHHDILIASGLSQAQALLLGKTEEEAYRELKKLNYSDEDAKIIAKHRVIPGNRPSNILFMSQLNPKNLGALIALYEHKIFVQGVIWNINSFDQWGVELGKQLLPDILQQLKGHSKQDGDIATKNLIARMRTKAETV